MKGQPPKDASLKALQGNAGKRLAPVEEQPADVAGQEKAESEIFFSEPGWEPADWLPEGAKVIWREQLPVLLRQTKLQKVGLPVFANYCHAQYRVQQYTRELADGETYVTASGYHRAKPQVELREKALAAMRNLADSLNLTPKSWINSMGTFAGRQLDMFMDGSSPAPAAPAGDAPAPDDGKPKGLSGYLAGRPTLN